MAKCSCNHCGQRIEFDDSMVDTVVNCPSCGMDTTLFFPGGVRPVIKVEKPPPKVVESRVPESHFSHQGSVDIPSDQSSQSGNAVSSIIPYKNVPALLSYYFGIFSFFVPCLGPLISIILGIIGLIKVKNLSLIHI